MTEVPNDFLPVKKTKLLHKKDNIKKDKDWKPLSPNFCPVVDPETEEKCGKFMRSWDLHFYDQYGMCESCYLKYNDGEGIKVQVIDTDPELVQEQTETKNDDD